MMSVYRTILAAVDLSEESRQIIDKAKGLADTHAAQLSLVHVVKPVEHVYGGFGAVGLAGDFSAQMATLEEQAVGQIRERLGELGASASVPESRQFVPVGNASSEIQRIAEETAADLIVLGTHGRHGLGLLLGSTANAVLHGCQRDVLAVRVAIEAES